MVPGQVTVKSGHELFGLGTVRQSDGIVLQGYVFLRLSVVE